MNAYETSTTVGGQGKIHLAGVPFQPGTEADVIISPKTSDTSPGTDASRRLGALLAALHHAHNNEPISSLRCEELYDRDHLR